jgi:acetolactate synthase-1/2/3 large subunit
MHDCDLMVCIGARFDDRITGRIDAFSPNSTKIHVDIDPSSINKNVRADLPIVGDCGFVLEEMVRIWRSKTNQPRTEAIAPWWQAIEGWRGRQSLRFKNSDTVIKPQHAIKRLYEAVKARDVYITT